MKKADAFLLNTSTIAKVQASRVSGLQIPPSWVPQEFKEKRIWVLNSDIQLDDDGNILQLGETPYLWLGDVCHIRPELLKPEAGTGEYTIADPKRRSICTSPMRKETLIDLLNVMEKYYGDSFPAVLYLMGGYVLANHYEALISQYGKVPSTIIYGEVQCGKTTATRAILGTMGVSDAKFFSELTDAKAYAFTSQTTLGMVIDDPDDLKQLVIKIIYHFQKAPVASMRGEYEPRTTFVTSMNESTLRKLSKSARLVFYICV